MAAVTSSWLGLSCLVITTTLALAIAYVVHLNTILKGVPNEVKELTGPRWADAELKDLYDQIKQKPIDYADHLPHRLDRRYIITGGNGLVGGYILLHLLTNGTAPSQIRILDLQSPARDDLLNNPAAKAVSFIKTDIRSPQAVDAALAEPWPTDSIAKLPLTVFHTAAVILASDRAPYLYDLPHAVNVEGTKNVLSAAQKHGASIFSATSSASISIRPVDPWVPFWRSEPRNFFQVLDEEDFWLPLRPRGEFYGNYAYSKAVAERLVCDADREGFRTGCLRPANAVFGTLTDNTIGSSFGRAETPTWITHITQNLVHGANIALAHLQHEAALLQCSCDSPESPDHKGKQDPKRNRRISARPFVITDPNPPIPYSALYGTITTLSTQPFRTVQLPPGPMLILAHILETYADFRHRYCPAALARLWPPVTGELKMLQPGLWSICTHLIADYKTLDAGRSMEEGGLGYRGVLTTREGLVGVMVEWNREIARGEAGDEGGVEGVGKQEGEKNEKGLLVRAKKVYVTPNMFAEQWRQRLVATSGNGDET